MATVSKWTPFGVALDITATGGSVVRKSATQFTVVINASWETYYSGAQTNYGMSAASGGVTHTISAFTGAKRSSGSGSFTGTYSISGNGAQTKTITVTFRNFNTDNGDSATKNVTFNVSVPAWTSYTVSYNANGGTGVPGAQTKWRDQTLKLSTTKPTRTGHSFLGWSTSSTATSATYSAGGNYTANAAATLYAVWKANTYTVSYNANGGTGAPGSQTKTYGKSLTLSSTKPTRTNYNFKGWGTSASTTTVTYASGATYTANSAATLYAVWELAYTKPRIKNVSATRCDSSGTVIDDGQNGLISFKWECDKTVSSIVVKWKLASDTTWSSVEIPASGTSGVVNHVIGENLLSIESTYDIHITVSDSNGSSYEITSLMSMKTVVDFLRGGNGIAFGKTAEIEGFADFDFEVYARSGVQIPNDKSICVMDTKGNKRRVLGISDSDNLLVGYDNYIKATGNTNVFGHDIYHYVSNIPTPSSYRPYRRRGDTLTISDMRTTGYVTDSGKQVRFFIPISVPIMGSPTVSVASVKGFILIQNGKYTHGSSGSAYVIPSSYSTGRYMFHGVSITATFSDTTNAVNNSPIGVIWDGTITFS